jgi:hypothetical protein
MLVFRTDDGRDSKGRRKDESTLETCTMGDMHDEESRIMMQESI